MLSLTLAEIGYTWALPFETNFILWLQSLGGDGSFIYYFFLFFTYFGEELVLVALLGMFYWGFDKVKGERLGAMLMTSSLLTPMLKNIVCRTRPFDSESGILNLKDVEGYSFPSGHSSASSAMIGGTAYEYGKGKYRWLWALGITIPVLVALSRNYLGAHYLTDVVAGLALGYGCVFLLGYLLNKFNNTYVYIALLVVGFAGMFYCTTEDYFTGYGLLLGFFAGTLIEKHFVHFDNTKVWWRIVLRTLVGGGIFLGLNTLIKLPFEGIMYDASGELLDSMIVFERIFRTIRYAVVVTVAVGVYPLLFRVMDKLWLKLHWIKPSDIPSNNAQPTAQVTSTESDKVVAE